MMDWTKLLFLFGVSAGVICAIGIVIDLLVPSFNVWPHTEWRFIGVIGMILWEAFYIATLVVWGLNLPAVSDFSAYTWVGSIFFIGGLAFFIWALVTLKLHVSLGVKGDLITHGPYALCRNPQSTGLVVQMIGAVLMNLSVDIIILATIHIVVLALTVIKEERWLAEQYGEKYASYKEYVPNRLVPDISRLASQGDAE